MTATEPSQALFAGAFLKALQRLRDRYTDMTLLQAMCFLTVAHRPGISQKELYGALDASDSAASRILAFLSHLGSRGMAGLDLVEMKTDQADRRKVNIYLTQKGRRLLDDIASDMKSVVGDDREAAD